MMRGLPLRYAIRSLRRERGLVAGVVVTLALAIGVNAAMLGIVTRLMLSAPPGVANPERVARVTLDVLSEDGERYAMTTTSYPVFRTIANVNAFSSVAAVYPTKIVSGRGADAREIDAIAASGRFFSTLGARASHGRLFGPADDELPAGSAVAVLSHSYWKSRFGADAGIVGATMTLAGEPYTIVGVAEPGFTGDGVAPVDVFIPLSAAMRSRGTAWMNEPDLNLVSIVVRMRDGVWAAQAAGLATAVARAADVRRGLAGVGMESLLPSAVRNSTQALIAFWLAGVSLVVLVIATVNVSTLLVLRAVRKRRDVAIRIALGASRVDLGMQSIVESTLLAAVGAATGLLLSRWLGDVARVTLLPDLASSEQFLDGRVLAASVALALLAGIGAALGPILLASGRHLTSELHGAGAGTLGSSAQSRTQRVLVGAQVALCSVLLVGAGLFVRSLERVRSQDLGFSTSKLLFVQLDFRDHLPGPRRDEVYREAARKLGAMSGVTGATVVQGVPFGPHSIPPISVPGLDAPPSAGGQLPIMYGSTPTYLKLLGVSLLQGRMLTDRDTRASAPVVLVNETMAREVWPAQSAVGKCIRIGFDPDMEPAPMAPTTLPCREVVGVVRDSRARSLRPIGREASLMQFYVPFEQLPAPPFADAAGVFGILVGVSSDADRMASQVQRFIQGSSSADVYARVRAYQDLLDPQMRPWRLGATLFVAFGLLAVCITAVGLFGVISYLVSQRTREIGLRLALGGTGSSIGLSVVGRALRMVAVGVAIGMGVALAAGPAARDLLFQTSPADVGVLLVAAATFVVVTIAASALPAWRAARVSPMTALRND